MTEIKKPRSPSTPGIFISVLMGRCRVPDGYDDFNASANRDFAAEPESPPTATTFHAGAVRLPPPPSGNRNRQATPASAASQSRQTRDPEGFSKTSVVSKAIRRKHGFPPAGRTTESSIARTGVCEMNASESAKRPVSPAVSSGERRTIPAPVRLSTTRYDRGAAPAEDCSTKTVSRPSGDCSGQTCEGPRPHPAETARSAAAAKNEKHGRKKGTPG
jgi:hypothetical protein